MAKITIRSQESLDKQPVKKRKFMLALRKHHGNVSAASRMTGICSGEHYGWLVEDKEYAEEFNKIDDEALDFVEEQHYKEIGRGNAEEIRFHLRTKGKKRGYTEKLDITSNGEPITGFTFIYPNELGKNAVTEVVEGQVVEDAKQLETTKNEKEIPY